MYRTTDDGSLTHDEARKAAIAAGEIQPVVIGDLNLDAATCLTGVGLGYSPAPEGADRLGWGSMLAENGVDPRAKEFPPSDGWFPWKSWPANIKPPNEGSLGAEYLDALLDVLAAHSANGGQFRATPTNFWPTDRNWFVWTDWDLLGTKVCGPEELMLGLEAHPAVEVIDWRARDAS